LNLHNISVFCVCKHWYVNENKNLAVIDGYDCAAMFCRHNRSKGGVAIFTKTGLKYQVINVDEFCVESDLEVVCVRVSLSHQTSDVIIVSIYRVPNGNHSIFLECFDRLFIHLARHSLPLIICGDFNIDITTKESLSVDFLDMLRSQNCRCLNYKPTRGNACLDNVLSDLHKDIINTVVLDPPLSDHNALLTSFSLDNIEQNEPNPTSITRPIRVFHKQNVDNFKMILAGINWNLTGSANDFDLFLSLFLQTMETCFPYKNIKTKAKSPSVKWYNEDLRRMREEMERLYSFWKWAQLYHVFVDETRIRYMRAKSDYKKALAQAKLNCNADSIASAPNQVKRAWELINKNNRKSSSPVVDSLSPQTFCDYFTSSVDDISNLVPSSLSGASNLVVNHPVNPPSFSLKPVSCEEVSKIVKSLKSSKCRDIYDISSVLVKEVLSEILLPLTWCLNLCILSGVFPDCLKLSKVTPIFKKGDHLCPGSYRPISVVPIFSKILEKAVIHQVTEFFETNNLFSKFQFGFRKGLSTVDAVRSLVSSVLNGFEEHAGTLSTMCDLSKAFDCVPHDILLVKLEHYGIKGVELNFFRTYLANRSQKVSYNNGLSDVAVVRTGVPQGSVLGPFLFLVMINDLPSNIVSPSTSLIFADDSTFFFGDVCLDNVKSQMANCLSDCNDWFKLNGFLLNNEKTQSIFFSLSNHDSGIPNTKASVKLLGITLDSKLNWSAHIDSVCSRLSRVLYLLRNLKKCIPMSYLKVAYFAFFNSIISYGLILWGCGSDTKRVLLLQKKAVRIITNSSYKAHCRPLFERERILTVFNLYIYLCLFDVKSNLSSMPIRSDAHDHLTRNRHKLDLPLVRLVKTQESFSYMGLKLFNRLPLQAHTIDIKSFKRKVLDWLLINPFYSIDEFFNLSSIDLVFSNI